MNKDEETYNHQISDENQTFILKNMEISHWPVDQFRYKLLLDILKVLYACP